MADNYREFAAELDAFADKVIPEQVQQVTQKVAMQALRGVVFKTPVDTGHARANWQTTLGEPTEEVTDRADTRREGNVAEQEGAAVIARAEPFGSIWISNSVPYILALEDGHSQEQAPQGMVAVTVAEIMTQFREVE